ncbi:MAG TPA: hypothetical protein DCF68_11320 [Cyanothece sp. UBA12306]|nr:hypothetical protein [Cyanothece sp. UBA12306]
MTSNIPETIGIISATVPEQVSRRGTRGGDDTGGLLWEEETAITEVAGLKRTEVELDKLKQEMKGFIAAMREILDEAEPPNSKMRLDEVELSVEVNGEGKVSLLGIGGKAGGKGAMTFKFKRKD